MIASELALPELPPWRAAATKPDIVIRLADTLSEPEMPEPVTPFLQIDRRGNIHLDVPTVARYEIAPDGTVRIVASAEAFLPEVRLFLLGPVFAIICHHKGLLPLHAASVRFPAGAVVLCGQTGMGKSCLAGALARRGHPVVCDDLSAVRVEHGGAPGVLPGFAQLRIWRDALEKFGIAPAGLVPNRVGQEKYRCEIGGVTVSGAEPLAIAAMILFKDRRSKEVDTPRPMAAEAAAAALRHNVHQSEIARRLGLFDAVKAATERMAAAVPAYELSTCSSLDGLDALADAIERQLVA